MLGHAELRCVNIASSSPPAVLRYTTVHVGTVPTQLDGIAAAAAGPTGASSLVGAISDCAALTGVLRASLAFDVAEQPVTYAQPV